MKKTLISAFVTAFAFVPFLSLGQVAHAGAPLTSNTTFRTVTNSTVYWYANGMRYPFPNEATYFTWFDSFNNVRVVDDSYLQVYPLAQENITYRPGAKLVKSTTGNKIYAVARYGILRQVVSDSIAAQLYGYDWNTKVQSIPDAFFSNYRIGTPIYSTYDYNVNNEYNGVTYPTDSLKQGSVSNYNTYNINNDGTTGSLSLGADRTNISSGQEVRLTAYYNSNLPYNGYIEIKNVRDSSLVRTCYNTSTCTVTALPERSVEGTSVQYIATVKDGNGSFITNHYSPTIYIDTNTYATGEASLSIANRSSAYNTETITFTASINRSGYTNTNTTLRVYDASNGSLVHTCSQNTYCSFTQTFGTSIGKTWYLRATNANGESVDSSYLTFNTLGNSSTNNGTLTLTADKTNITSGQAVYLYARYQYSGTNVSRIEIKEGRSGNTVKTCYNTTCAVTVYPYQSGYTSTQYYATAYASNGTQLDTVYSPTIYFNGTTTTYTPTPTYYGTSTVNDLRLNMSSTLIHSGDLVQITANAYGHWNYTGSHIDILDTRTGNIVGTCYNQGWCTTSVHVYRNSGEATMRYEARFYETNGSYRMDEIGTPIYFIIN